MRREIPYAFVTFGVTCFLSPTAVAQAIQSDTPFTVQDARNLSAEALGARLIGRTVGRVVAAQRREDGSNGKTPRQVDLFLAPKMPWPHIRNICSVDVVKVEYNWFDFESSKENDVLKVHHIEAKSRFLPAEVAVGNDDGDYQAIETACARLTDVERAFRAPEAGDARWLVAMHQQYSSNESTANAFAFACSDFDDRTCAKARLVLRALALEDSVETVLIDCEMPRFKDQVNYCYRLTFSYQNSDSPEWVLKLYGGMSDGSAPIRIRRASLEHVRKPIGIS